MAEKRARDENKHLRLSQTMRGNNGKSHSLKHEVYFIFSLSFFVPTEFSSEQRNCFFFATSTSPLHSHNTPSAHFFPLMELLAALLCLVSYQVALTISIPKVVISITNAIFALSLSLGFTLINNERQNRSWLCLTDDLSCPLGRCFHPNLRMCSDFSGEKTRVTCKVHVEGKRLICAS